MSRHHVHSAAVGDDRHAPLVIDKQLARIRAEAAYFEGIAIEPSRDEYGRRTLILTRGAWTREVAVADLADALAHLAAAPPPANDLDLPTGQRGRKDFEKASAVCAQHGCELRRAEGLILARHGEQRTLPTLEAVLAFLETIQELE